MTHPWGPYSPYGGRHMAALHIILRCIETRTPHRIPEDARQ